MQAADIMTSSVVAVGPETNVCEVAKLMLERGISAVPVVAADGHLLGILSEGDLMRRSELGTEKRRSWWLAMITDHATMAKEYTKASARKARDVMTAPVITVEETAPIDRIVGLLEQNHIKRVPVVREGRVIGIVSRANLLRVLASVSIEKVAGLDDKVIRTELMRELGRQPWWDGSLTNVSVSDGVVELTGFAETEEQRTAMRVAAERMPGVRDVHDNMIIRPRIVTYS
jgi:CBS domain-containing protein